MHDITTKFGEALLMAFGMFWKTGWSLVYAEMTHFALDYTFWLNLVFLALAIALFISARRHPMHHGDHHAAHRGH